jgi:hypothetical protein
MSTFRYRSVTRLLAVAAGLLAVALVAGVVVQALTRSDRVSGSPPSDSLLVTGDDPLTGGVPIPVVLATEKLRRCNCPQLPDSGPMSPEHVDEALFDAGGGRILLRYDTGIDLYYEPETRSEEEYVSGWQETINEGWPGTLIPLRGTQAAAAERDESSQPGLGNAVLDWLEGPYSLAMYGRGGQSLAELIPLAESLPKATVAAASTPGEAERSDPPTEGESTDPTSGGAMFTFDNPLGPQAVKIPVEVATGFLARCNCPRLPGSGPASAEHVTAAYTDELGQIGLTFDSGVEMIYTPDARTAQQFADQMAEEIADGTWPGGSLVTVRGIVAAARDLDDRGPAVVTWIEGSHRVQLYSKGKQRLPELLTIAEAMRQGTTGVVSDNS